MTGIQMAVNSTRTAYALANLLGVSHQRVNYWLKTGRVPMGCIPQVSSMTNVPVRFLIKDWFI